MASVTPKQDSVQLEEMHTVYRQGGAGRAMAPHVVYRDGRCPHDGCEQSLRAIDFRLEAFGRAVHDPLVRAWWDDSGFVGKCPSCHGWIHFTIRGKKSLTESEARSVPQLPSNWSDEAIIL